jgi:hypothetical protein
VMLSTAKWYIHGLNKTYAILSTVLTWYFINTPYTLTWQGTFFPPR